MLSGLIEGGVWKLHPALRRLLFHGRGRFWEDETVIRFLLAKTNSQGEIMSTFLESGLLALLAIFIAVYLVAVHSSRHLICRARDT